MTTEPIIKLPESDSLDIEALSALFRHTTNSYKYIFFISVLELLRDHCFNPNEPLSFYDLTIGMLATAWGPYRLFGLSFGSQDTVVAKLEQLDLDFSASKSVNTRLNKSLLESALKKTNIGGSLKLMNFVPYRLLVPFLEEDLKKVDKGAWMKLEYAMPAIVNKRFYELRLPYRFDSDDYKKCENIFIHPDWSLYLERHFPTVFEWAAWNWVEYMQKRNPAVSDLYQKLSTVQKN